MRGPSGMPFCVSVAICGRVPLAAVELADYLGKIGGTLTPSLVSCSAGFWTCL
jgi:hypothetical protein